jgi:lactoylglutathione lyase
MAVQKIEHIGIAVKDLETSIRFYETFIGLKLKGTLVIGDGEVRLAFLGFEHSDETEVELIAGKKGELAEEGIVHHVAFTVDDLDAEKARLKELGAHFVDEEFSVLSNGSRYIFFTGPDGEQLEFFETKGVSKRF